MAEMRKAHNILVGKPDGKRPLRKPRHRWEDNIRGMVSTGCNWLKIGTSGRPFLTW
jgi:hypothetical protein